MRWTDNDVALLDEARELPRRQARPGARRRTAEDPDEIRTYGHIVVDEVQDLTPMQLRMVVAPLAERQHDGRRRHRPGHRARWRPTTGTTCCAYLPDQQPSRVIGLSVGYRIPAQIMALANQVMLAATPTLRAPTSVRQSDDVPEFVALEPPTSCSAECRRGDATLTRRHRRRHDRRGRSRLDGRRRRRRPSTAAGIEHGRATRTGLEQGVTVVPVSVVKGLELDGVVVVEPAAIVAESSRACAPSTSRSPAAPSG